MYRTWRGPAGRFHDIEPVQSGKVFCLTVGAAALVVIANREFITYGLPVGEVLVAALAAVWILLVVRDWRWGIWGMIAYLPFVGLPQIITYPNTTLPVLAKDILFVAPCYLSLGAGVLTRRLRIQSYGLPWQLLLLFGAINVVEFFNPALSSKVVGLIGMKIWLLYIPLAFIIPQFVGSVKRLRTVLRVITYLSAGPAALGLVEFALIHAGLTGTVWSWYGKAAQAMFANGGGADLGDKQYLFHIPSTFPSQGQYSYFLLMSIACGFALLGLECDPKRIGLAWAIIGCDCIAALTSGAKAAFLYVPILLALIALGTRGVKGLLRMIPMAAGSLGLTVVLLGGAGAGLYALVSQATAVYGQQILTQELAGALQTAALGLGPGMDSGSAGHYSGNDATFVWLAEGWWAQVIYELGIPGLALVAGIWLVILWEGWTIRRALQDQVLARIAVCMVAYIIVMLYASLKAVPLNQDPGNVYIWIAVGLLVSLPGLERVTSRSASPGDRDQ